MKKIGMLMIVFLLLCGCVMAVSAVWRQDAVIAGPNEKTEKALTWPSFFLQKDGDRELTQSEQNSGYTYATDIGCESLLADGSLELYLNDQKLDADDFIYDVGDYGGLQLKTGDEIRVVVDLPMDDEMLDWELEIRHAGRTYTIDRSDDWTVQTIEFVVADSVYITAQNNGYIH